MRPPAILALGSVNADFQVRVAEPLESGKTLLANCFVRLGGGKAANVAYLARRFGVPATLFGRVGDDELSEQALEPLRQAGVDIDHVTIAPNCATAVSMIMVPPEGKKSIVLASNANDSWNGAAIRAMTAAILDAPDGSVLVADFEVPAQVVEQALDAASRRGFQTVIDPSFTDRVDLANLPAIHAIAPNAKEAAALIGTATDTLEGAAGAARKLVDAGVAIVCVKLAAGGCVVAADGSITVIPSTPVDVVDTTGAGDAFAGALAFALLEGKSPIEAACFATAAADVAVTGYGSQKSYPTREQVEDLVPQLAERAHAFEP